MNGSVNMKKYIRLALIFGWFFAFQSPYNEAGVTMSTLVGPFASENECKAELDEMKLLAKELRVPSQFTKCQYRQEM